MIPPRNWRGEMYCPFCGVKNDAGATQCFVCSKKLPSLNGETTPAQRPRSGQQRTMSAGPVAARLGDRLIALVLDTIFVSAILLVGTAGLLTRWPKVLAGLSLTAILSGGAAATLLVVFIYHWLLEGAFGATMGKAIVGVRVIRQDDGRAPGLGLAAIRNAFRLIDGLALYLVGFFVAAFSRGRRRIGDYAANTIVLEHAISVGERVTVVLLWVVGIGAAVWGTWVMCPSWFRLPPR